MQKCIALYLFLVHKVIIGQHIIRKWENVYSETSIYQEKRFIFVSLVLASFYIFVVILCLFSCVFVWCYISDVSVNPDIITLSKTPFLLPSIAFNQIVLYLMWGILCQWLICLEMLPRLLALMSNAYLDHDSRNAYVAVRNLIAGERTAFTLIKRCIFLLSETL